MATPTKLTLIFVGWHVEGVGNGANHARSAPLSTAIEAALVHVCFCSYLEVIVPFLKQRENAGGSQMKFLLVGPMAYV